MNALALLLSLWTARASAAAVAPPIVFHPAGPAVIAALPTIDDPARPWLRSGPDSLTVDLRGQWEPLSRSQGDFGTCQAFAAVAIAEAAYFRNGGACLRLSEADLYMQSNVLRWDCWKDDAKDCTGFQNGYTAGVLLHDLLTTGVLPGDDYARIMGVYEKALEDDHEIARFLKDPSGAARLSRDRADIAQKLEHYADVSGAPEPARRRQSVAALFSGYSQAYGAALPIKDRWTLPPGPACAAKGWLAERFIDGELLQGRPVAVGMYLDKLPEWHVDPQGAQLGHSFVIDGLTVARAPGGGFTKTYRTRNSWPGVQPTVKTDELCRVITADSLRGPAETPAPADPWAALR